MRTAGLMTKVASLLLLSVLSCGSPAHAQMPAPQGTPTRRAGITGEQAIAIAKRVMRERNPEIRDFFKVEAEIENGRWEVFGIFIMGYDDRGQPLGCVGGHGWVILDTTGKVIEYRPGA